MPYYGLPTSGTLPVALPASRSNHDFVHAPRRARSLAASRARAPSTSLGARPLAGPCSGSDPAGPDDARIDVARADG